MSQGYFDFDQYIRQGEPAQRERAEAWRVAIGLQAVDGLQVSEYLKETARRHIEGEISIDEAKELVKQYYVTKTQHDDDDEEKEEADRVSTNITKLINERSFTFNAAGIIAIHKAIFDGVFKHAGKLRDYDITKKEWVLRGDTVLYGRWQDLRMALEYDIDQEKQFEYKGLSMDEVITHLARFIAGIWQTHPFREGNTRTTAVFAIKYLQSIGFKTDNRLFEQHSWYFRNALVRANYKNAVKGIDYSPVYLERFFRNLLLGEKWNLQNRYLHINPTKEWLVQPMIREDDTVNDTVNDTVKTGNTAARPFGTLAEQSGARLSMTEQTVLKAISLHPDYSYEKLAAYCKLSRPTIARSVKTLQGRNYIRRIGSDKTGRWEIVEANTCARLEETLS